MVDDVLRRTDAVGGEGFIPLESLVVPQRRTGDAALHVLELFRRAALHLHLG